ncbi:MAG: hypothetical protein HYY52_03470 [Candidatus Melainabacteria bacterium]|nr:hypothetical protein [Candidatus Melainabacteria bacterium]
MKKCFLFLLLLFSLPLQAYSEINWELLYQPRQRIVKSIGVYNELIFIGTGNGVLVSEDKGKSWNDFGSNQLLKDPTGNSSVNWIHIDETSKKIFIATSFGTYYSDINSPDWKKFFESTKIESNEVNSLTLDNDNVYLCTSDGFWTCDSNDFSCKRLNQGLEPDNLSGNYEVYYCLKHNDDLYLGTSNGIYLLNKKNLYWQNISSNIQTLPNGRINIRHLLIDKEENTWIASGNGIYRKKKDDILWEKISDGIKKNNDGLQEAFYLFQSDEKLYIACASGIDFYDKETNSWKDISSGIRTKESSKNVYWLTKLDNDLFAATDEGLFRKRTGELATGRNGEIILKGKVETDFASLEEIEPTVQEVQKQALKFASLPTDKDYKRFRTQARIRNIIPRVGFDINTTGTSTDYYQLQKGISTDIALSNQFDADRITRLQRDGRSFKQLSVLWNTNQFIYDDEIKEILNQARLTANIKENLLDDVTRIYYQRKKLQLETLLHPPGEASEKLSKQIEVAELTGQLDSRTGGWFSREIEKRKMVSSKR